MGKTWKLDSFLKESQRFHGICLSTSNVDRCGSLASLTSVRDAPSDEGYPVQRLNVRPRWDAAVRDNVGDAPQ